jgi:hypothetical protein
MRPPPGAILWHQQRRKAIGEARANAHQIRAVDPISDTPDASLATTVVPRVSCFKTSQSSFATDGGK